MKKLQDSAKNAAPVKTVVPPAPKKEPAVKKATAKKPMGKIPSIAEQQAKPQYKVADLPTDPEDWHEKPVARGVAGRPLDETPALVGAKRAQVKCDINVDSLAYWNDPAGKRDLDFKSPFGLSKEQYISFTPDPGGWNNVRMSMEILFVLAAITNRTLVLPPKEPLYLLNKDTAARHRGFADFFPLDNPNFPVKIMNMQDFLNLPAQQALLDEKGSTERQSILNAADHCDRRKGSSASCVPIYEFLAEVGHNPELSSVSDCVIFDADALQDPESPSTEGKALAETYCGEKRRVTYWNHEDHSQHDHLHLPAQIKQFRLLTHFYNMLYFSDPKVGNYFKRFVRDYLHYNDVIYCAAGKIVKAVQKEAMALGFSLDAEGGGGYSSMHVRRGDLQYKKVKIPAKEWYDNTKEVWQDKEILYLATDERNKTFFDDLAVHYEVRFLDDYWDLAGLSGLDPNYMGMIDTIVASRARAFAGTWFSTFSGYINRLRGYHGMSMKDSWYSFLPKKTAVHEWEIVKHSAYAFEWPDGWVGIDSDTFPERDKF
uniref:Uncharacterized protein n=1 Tax=Entomoneis paludosa TaxID=265537 RepID=A0A7S3DMJ3_9STRA